MVEQTKQINIQLLRARTPRPKDLPDEEGDHRMTPQERIETHRARMPRQYRKVYDIAMNGRSLRAAVNSQCIECMGYVFSEVKQCCSPQCPLFPYRPLNGISYGVSGAGQSGAESTKAGKGGNHVG